MKTHIPLADEFPAATEEDWRALVHAALKGVPFDKKLTVKTRDGITLPALSGREASAHAIPAARGIAPWGICARLDHPDPQEANRLALEELEGGADTLILSLTGSRGARGFGLPDCAARTLDHVFAGIHLDLISLRLEPGEDAARNALALGQWLKGRGYVPAALRVDFGLPLGDADALSAIQTLQTLGFQGPFLNCDGRMVHEAGGSEAQELGFILAAAEQGLREGLAQGIAPQTMREALSFSLVADQDQVLTMAKVRAFRLLLARFDEVCGFDVIPASLHAETAWRMQTRRDCQVTILRNVIAAFSAGVAGADSINVIPHTAAIGLPDAAARRLARNISHILVSEAHIARMMDPACGSGTIETATHALCEAAWPIFQSISQQSFNNQRGLAAALGNGFLAAIIAPVWEGRSRDIATRRIAVTGTSEFPNLHEQKPDILLPRQADGFPSLLPIHRDAESFERLRDEAEERNKQGNPARVFLANLGRIGDFSARATFAQNLFEAGGIAEITNDGFIAEGGTDIPALLNAFKQSGAQIACLCSSDSIYEQEAKVTALALREAGCKAIYIACKPTNEANEYKSSGISGFIYMGMDVVEFLWSCLTIRA